MIVGRGRNLGTAGKHHAGCSFTKTMKKTKLKGIGLFMALLIVMLPVAFADTISPQWDLAGNLITDGTTFREYNSLNQLVRIRNGTNSSSPVLQEFIHDSDHEKILMKQTFFSNGSVKETVYYVSENYVKISNQSGDFDYLYVRDEDGNVIAQKNPDGSKYFMHKDNIGSTGAVTNESGDVLEQTVYSPLGDIVSGGEVSRFSYESKEFDSVVGDFDFHFRKYKSDWGIFAQPDDRISNVYDPQNLNRYMFERGNSYRFVDENGHVFWDKLFTATLSFVSSIGIAVAGVGLGVTTSASGVGAVAGVAIGTFGFANAGDAAVDAWKAIVEDEEYFEKDKGGILANLGNLIGGDNGVAVGSSLELAISAGFLPNSGSGTSFLGYVQGIVSSMDLTVSSLAFRNMFHNSQLANNLDHVRSSNLGQSSKESIAKSMAYTSGSSSNVQWHYNANKGTYQYWVGKGAPSNSDYVPVSESK